MNKGKEYSERKPLVAVIKHNVPQSVKNTLFHWHMYQDDRYLAWENGKFGRYYMGEDGQPYFDSSVYSEKEIGEITTFEAEEENALDNEKRSHVRNTI